MTKARSAQIGLCVAVLAVVGLTAACGSDSSSNAMAPMTTTAPTTMPTNTTIAAGQPTAAATITIKNFAFGAPITVQPGATVTVTNDGTETHTLSADDAAFDTGNVLGGKSATFVAPSTPGTYAFHCNIHDMHGMLRVAA